MAQSLATIKYGNYTFNPVPQFGIRDNIKRLGESGYGGGNIERSVTLKGNLFGSNLNEVQTKIWALQAALALDGQVLYINDGVTTRVNTIAKVLSVDIPEDWGQYDAEYTIRLLYFPLSETHYNPITVSYNGYTFNPIPIMGREFVVNRPSPEAARDAARVTITLQGILDKGTTTGNFTEWNAILAAMATDGTLTYGSFVQSVRAGRATYAPDIGDRRLSYTLSFDYDTQVAASGVKKMSSSRSIDNSERVAVHYLPFSNDALTQRLGRNGQHIIASGFIVADTMANARAAAMTEIAAQFPVTSDVIEENRRIVEYPSEYKIEWNVTRFYPTPALTGGVYGGSPVIF